MENKIIFISPDGKGHMFDFMVCQSKPFCAFIPDFCSFMVFRTSLRRIVFNYTIFGKEKDNYGTVVLHSKDEAFDLFKSLLGACFVRVSDLFLG